MTLVVNLLGGPGSGKSTTAAGVFYELKLAGVNCELVTEFAKDVVWEQNYRLLENQLYLLANQYHRQWRVADQVDVMVTDSPIFLCLIYGQETSETYKTFVMELYERFENHAYFVERLKEYNPKGRTQTEEEAKALDLQVLNVMKDNGVPFKRVRGDRTAVQTIVADVLGALNVSGNSVDGDVTQTSLYDRLSKHPIRPLSNL